MKRTLTVSLVALVAASCGPTPAPEPQGPPAVVAPTPAPQQSQRPQPRPRPQPAPARNEPRDMCGARPLQYLVGKPRTEIPVPVNVSNRRVTCTTCPVTMDFREDRLNIFFDATTGIIKEVKCG
jgi:hypothetical protein